MQHIFVYEYLSGGGALADEAEAAELLPQGVAMRDAIVADLRRLPGVRVSCAVCGRPGAGLPPGPRTELAPVVAEPGESATAFVRRQARGHDRVWVIAPESGGLLAALQAVVEPGRWLGCDAAALWVASSKSLTLTALAAHGISTPLDFAASARRWVVKPDDGAGAVDTRVFDDLAAATAHADARTLSGQRVVQEPWVDGEALSMSLLAGPGWVQALAFNRQRIKLSADGSVHYHGVDIAAIDPRQNPRALRLHLLAPDLLRALPGLRGFVGVDLVWHAQRGPVVIEVNPRVTSAYVGLSAALQRNLAGDVLTAHAAEASHA